MKRYLIFLLILSIPLFNVLQASAQSYEPTSTWPYMYSDFTDGELQRIDGKKTAGVFNIHLAEGRLHFVEDGFIREVSPSEVLSVRIGGDIFTSTGGTMMKVLAKGEQTLVTEETKINFAALGETGGAYGSSSNTTSTQAFSSFEGIGGTRSNMNHMEIRSSKDDGKILPLEKKIYMVIPGKVVFASKRDFMEISDGFQDEAKTFLKERKIKWKDPQSVLEAADFLAKKLEK